jgi:hypothetical protein
LDLWTTGFAVIGLAFDIAISGLTPLAATLCPLRLCGSIPSAEASSTQQMADHEFRAFAKHPLLPLYGRDVKLRTP